MAYKMLDPKYTAQSLLDAHCAIRHKTMIAFAENFRAYAPESGYSDEILIVKIREQRSSHIQTVMQQVYWTDCDDQGDRSQGPNAMDTSARIAHELSPEQDRWLANKLCLFCEKHAYERGKRCPSPKPEYKGKRFQTRSAPKQGQGKGKGKTSNVQQVEEESSAGSSAQIAALKGKGKAKSSDAASMASASTIKDINARIVEIDDFSENFQYEV
ncbi:uncharacterized protein LAESUDRAFT_757975 [Laetiporus sulphureus 93-53]|uniref:Uncharacterized protein n=1 Tax=Laetiporus sulphureus 93-53 TaxID=1314785 RepID=A0A165EV66_9APHY|nr:uncharacterized protein LAESUDRAFT_757975 [Laetiporus sulphureus 93-53]KZT07828.1 hypothetical protein LAESUDRAFT_757975 [Laetiporus sulphureus 93-53]